MKSERGSADIFRVIAVTDGRELRWITAEVCRQLKQKYGSRLIAYCRSKDSGDYYRGLGWFDEVIEQDLLHVAALQPVTDEAAVFERSRRIETTLGDTYNRARMIRRDFGRGFYLGGSGHPKAYYSEVPTWPQMVHAYNELFDFWLKEYRDNGITLHLNPLKEEAVVARALNVPVRYLYAARVDNLFYWAVNEMIDNPFVEPAFRALEAANVGTIEDLGQYAQDAGQRRLIVGTNPFRRLAQRLWSITYQWLYRFRHRSALRPSYYYWSNAAYLIREALDQYRLRHPRVASLDDLRNKKFVYFPLHTEPEMSLHWMSPECFIQIEAIARLARDLPADTLLVVKETIYGFGRRPRDFYEQLRAFKNVVVIDAFERGIEVMQASVAVATMTGSGGLEAALTGKPVILFGRHNYYDFLDHVRKVWRDDDLRPAIHDLVESPLDPQKAKRDGARLKEAVRQVCFDMGSYSNVTPHKFEPEVVGRAVTGLEATFDGTFKTMPDEWRVR